MATNHSSYQDAAADSVWGSDPWPPEHTVILSSRQEPAEQMPSTPPWNTPREARQHQPTAVAHGTE